MPDRLSGWHRRMPTDELIDRIEMYAWSGEGCRDDDCRSRYRALGADATDIVRRREAVRRGLGVDGPIQRERLRERFDNAKRAISVTEVLFERGVNVSSWREGKGYKIPCPLGIHTDSSPSFHVYDGDRGWYCYGCHQGGSIIDLIMLLDKTDSPREALDALQTIWRDQRPPGVGSRKV